MGKDSSVKSTFAKVLVGHPDYQVTGDSVVFKGQDLLEMAADERSLAGLFMSFQSPVEIPDMSNINFLRMSYNTKREKLGCLSLEYLSTRDESVFEKNLKRLTQAKFKHRQGQSHCSLDGSEFAETMEVDKEAEGSGEVEVVEVDVQALTTSFEDD